MPCLGETVHCFHVSGVMDRTFAVFSLLLIMNRRSGRGHVNEGLCCLRVLDMHVDIDITGHLILPITNHYYRISTSLSVDLCVRYAGRSRYYWTSNTNHN